MKEKENSFESVKSDLSDEQNDSDYIKDKTDNNRNSNIINESKTQIRKSLMFSNHENTSNNLNDINKIDIIKNSSTFFKNEKINGDWGLTEEIFKNKNPGQKDNSIPFLDIQDKKNTKIVLIKVIDQNYYEGHLKLKNNLQSEYLIFKILNEKQVYSITPCLYYIEPGKEIIINIKRFEKLTINEAKNASDYLIVIVAHTKNKIEDVNDAKIYINKNDIYSPEYQLYSFNITLDYGYNYKTYEKEEKDMRNIYDKYESQLNINKITDVEIIKNLMNNLKKEIEIYQKKIDELKSILNDIGKKNIIKQEETIFDKETYYQISQGKAYKELDEEDDKDNDIQLPLLLLYLSICLFLGKFLKFFLFG